MKTYKVKVKGFRRVPVEEVIEVTGETSDAVFRSFDKSGDIQDPEIVSVVGNDDEYYPEVEGRLERLTRNAEERFLEHQDPTKILWDLPIELSEEDVTWVRAWQPHVRVSSEVYMESFSEEDIPDGEDQNDYAWDNFRLADYEATDLENYELLEGYQIRFTEFGKSKIRWFLIDRLLSNTPPWGLGVNENQR